jgi:enamine deaminase RidA (YjgF/YER057c/UK114 family)
MRKLIALMMLALITTAVAAEDVESVQPAAPATNAAPERIERDGLSVTFTGAAPRNRTGYDTPWHYSAALRAGDFVYLSGTIIGAAPGDTLPLSRERFRESTEAAFERMERYLAAADASLAGLAKINTFHVLDGKVTEMAIDEQALVIAEVKQSYTEEPHPAWTAVGTSGLFAPLGIVEIEVVVYAPLSAAPQERGQ